MPCAALLELMAEDKPAVVVLDDLHWADRASIELVAALLRRVPPPRCCWRSPSGPARLPSG